MNQLITEARVENLNKVLDFINTELKSVGCHAKIKMQFALAVEEVFVNISHYAHGPHTGDAVIRIAAGDEVVIEFEDVGRQISDVSNEASVEIMPMLYRIYHVGLSLLIFDHCLRKKISSGVKLSNI